MYSLVPAGSFLKQAKKFVKNNYRHQEQLTKALKKLSENPFALSLKTHRVYHRVTGKKFSSWVSGDTRIIWDFAKDGTQAILLIDLGGHSGKDKVYR